MFSPTFLCLFAAFIMPGSCREELTGDTSTIRNNRSGETVSSVEPVTMETDNMTSTAYIQEDDVVVNERNQSSTSGNTVYVISLVP